jgi:hypothetical protein
MPSLPSLHQVADTIKTPSVALWILIVVAVVAMALSRHALYRMRKALLEQDIPCFQKHWRTARLASKVFAGALFVLFVVQVVDKEDGYAIPLNSVYTVNMVLLILYWHALQRVQDSVEVAMNGGVYMDYILHRVVEAEHLMCGMCKFTAFVAGAIVVTSFNWSALKHKLTY